ncbi:hypothetical protein RFI_03069 [Reticulomyxa filosa]|uniref:GOLD domain-containing protein n=1 Tax=Reticulomyxa filosa TaxID=46433 RepID=X6P8P6_RETFI|nr:hypothetical protein RFI_03069 [Reticulomyxa filosa]|eukprot:ETO34027.1 hypothetical protein RFI_03069 [Reticulomyxa filosa]
MLKVGKEFFYCALKKTRKLEEFKKGDIFMGSFSFSKSIENTVQIIIFDPNGKNVYQSSATKDTFSINTILEGEYDACFTNSGMQIGVVSFTLEDQLLQKYKNNINGGLSKSEHIEPLQQQITDLLALSKATTKRWEI